MKIELHQIEKVFYKKNILHNLNWTIQAGEFWYLQGRSGIGKTTLLRILMGLETPDGGFIQGLKDIHISAVFQEHRLCEWLTAYQNVQLVCTNTKQEIEAALKILIPSDAIHRPIGTLSGGMQRRVALVRALLPESDLVLLDEPFSGLDIENQKLALDFILENQKARAIILVSHEIPRMQKSYYSLILSESTYEYQ